MPESYVTQRTQLRRMCSVAVGPMLGGPKATFTGHTLRAAAWSTRAAASSRRGNGFYSFGGVLGPLPRSWMVDQWILQKDKILPRMRELGIVGVLPAFQGVVPWSLAESRAAADAEVVRKKQGTCPIS